MYHERILTDRLYRLFSVFPVVVVTGARQVGKSTFLANTLGKNIDTVVFDPVIDIENARMDPELFLNNRRPPVIFDEIQYCPELVPALKRRIDRDRSPGQYILTGSQQWGVMRSITESLAGRAVFLDIDGFNIAEITHEKHQDTWLDKWIEAPEKFLKTLSERHLTNTTLYEQLWRGFLPEAHFIPLDTIPDFHAAYQRTYIERDVRLFADVSDWQLFGRFLRLVAALTAQEINYSQVGRKLGLTPQTTRRWLDILKATFQWFELEPFSRNSIKKISGKPKGYISDTGLACAAQAISSPTAIGGHPLWGALFETAVVAEIRKQCSFMSPRPMMYHWRTYSGAEVDIIIEYNGRFYPIEIKAKSNPSRGDTSGITAFRKQYPDMQVEKGIVLAPVERPIPISENDYALPWDIKK
ncbi:MAG: ATP-binding protein [Deltaproteobacteria bacterium]|nr:ATP-binding protein [Deltaproteobacteria bacterium]